MNRNKRLFKDLQLFTAPAIARSNAEALIPTQESHDIIQGAVEQSAVLQRGRKLANMTASQYKMPVLDLLPGPPYSPELNPIELFWAWLKRFLRKILPSAPSFDDALSTAFHLW